MGATSSRTVSTPSPSATRRPRRRASGEESRSGMKRASTLSRPRARTARAATTELSTPPERPTTSPRRFSVPRTCSRSAASIREVAAAGSIPRTSLENMVLRAKASIADGPLMASLKVANAKEGTMRRLPKPGSGNC